MAHILAIRFSALGDIAMAIPVLYSFAKHYPQHEVTLLSRPVAGALLAEAPRNVHFIGVDLKQYAGLKGLWRLYEELKKMSFDAVADLHDVIRSKVLRAAFRHAGLPTTHINKGRNAKRALTRRLNKQKVQLTPSTERYLQTFTALGYPFTIDFTSIYGGRKPDTATNTEMPTRKEGEKWIGIAPFAAHKGKIYPLTQMEKVIAMLSKQEKNRIFLFGAGAYEKTWCEKWQSAYEHTESLVGKFKMSNELALMSQMDVMLTMDSANMHLAGLVKTPTVSIWGATHPYAGFSGMPAEGSQQMGSDMDCRPCSIFGNKNCYRKDYACLWSIKPENIVETINAVISSKAEYTETT